MKGLLLDISYGAEEGKLATRLYVKTAKGTQVIEDTEFAPYFYLATKQAPSAIKLEGVKEVVRRDADTLKIVCSTPADVPKAREKAKQFGRVSEADIPFTQRYLIDHALKPMQTYEWKGLEFAPTDGDVALKRVAMDFETYNQRGFSVADKDPILLASAHDGKEDRVFTWKKIKRPFVTSLKGEKGTLEEFAKAMQEADVVYTYNGDNFDLPYLRDRMKALKIEQGLGLNGEQTRFRNTQRGVSAFIPGKAHVDVYQAISFLARIGALKLPRYTLADVYAEISGKKKVLIDKKGIWKMWDSGHGLEELADYNLDDAHATWELGEYVLPLYTAFAKLVGSTLSDVCRMTTGQMVEQLLLSSSFKRGVIAPNKPGSGELATRAQSPIEGGFVKTPPAGLHDRVAVLDFRGLYPSIIISHNISPETLGCDCCEDASVSPQGHRFCRKKKGIIPEMLETLVKNRIAVKKRMREATGKERVRLDAEQWALKIVANSTYGYTLYARARWYSRQCGEATTAWARHYVQDLIAKAGEAGFEVLYGDSLTADRFVTVLDPQGNVRIKSIEELFNEHKGAAWKAGQKEVANPLGWKALTVDPETRKPCWAPVTEVIRHKANKRIFRVNQKYGETRVTEDHSLIIENEGYQCAKPSEMGKSPMATVPIVPRVKPVRKIDVFKQLEGYTHTTRYKGRVKTAKASADGKQVWFNWSNQRNAVRIKRHLKVGSREFSAFLRLLALYIGEGSSSTPETTSSRWGASIANSNKKLLKQLQNDYHLLFDNAKACMIPSMVGKRTLHYSGKTLVYEDKTHKLQMMNKLAAVFFRQLCGQKSRGKRIPEFVFHLPEREQREFLEWLLKGDGSRWADKRYTAEYHKNNFKYTTNSLQLISGLTLLLRQLGINFSLNYRPSKGAYTVSTSARTNARLETRVREEAYDGYVYDLSVAGSHMFVDSCGQILLHNTDSAFLKLGGKSKEDVIAFVKDYNKQLPEAMEVEFEGYYPRCIFVTRRVGGAAKKRYALLREDGQVEITGLEFVRRDWSALAKNAQQKVVQAVLENKVEEAKRIVLQTIEGVRANTFPLDDFVIYTQLKRRTGNYDAVGPHVKAAMRLEKSGETVGAGTTIGYVVTQGSGNIGDRAYPVELVGNRKPDADYYVNNQLLPAVMKILAELGIKEDELTTKGKQTGLSQWD